MPIEGDDITEFLESKMSATKIIKDLNEKLAEAVRKQKDSEALKNAKRGKNMKNDFIKREDAHHMVRFLKRYVSREIREMHGVLEMVDYGDVQVGIDKIPAVGAWINVKDRLPLDDKDILIVTQSKNGHRSIDKGYYDGDRIIHRGSAMVTHWMPLPELPEDDNDA